MPIRVVAFDADDTLWHNEVYFQQAEEAFCALMENYLPRHTVSRELLRTELENLPLYGYGIKAFTLSMVETALRISDRHLPMSAIETIIGLGKAIVQKPVTVLDGVHDVLAALQPHFRLVVATKGDLLDQERKLNASGLQHYFHHIEIMTEKQPKDFEKLLRHLDTPANEFVMIGNSLKSDVLPVLQLGGTGIQIPYHVTWAHEHAEAPLQHPHFRSFDSVRHVVDYLLP